MLVQAPKYALEESLPATGQSQTKIGHRGIVFPAEGARRTAPEKPSRRNYNVPFRTTTVRLLLSGRNPGECLTSFQEAGAGARRAVPPEKPSSPQKNVNSAPADEFALPSHPKEMSRISGCKHYAVS